MEEATSRFEQIEIPLPEPVHEQTSVTGTLGVPEWWPTGSRVGVVLAHVADVDPPYRKRRAAQVDIFLGGRRIGERYREPRR